MFLSRLFKKTKAKAMLVLAGLTMVFGVGAAVTTVAATQQNEVVETNAVSDGYKYITGTSDALDGWANKGAYSMSTSSGGGFYYRLNLPLKNGTEFKITNMTWTNAKGASTISNHSSGTFGGSDNIVCNTAGSYDIAWDGSNVHIWDAGGIDTSYTGWVIAGTFSSPNWSPATALEMVSDGSTNKAKLLDISMSASTQFRICYSDGCQLRDWKDWANTPSGFTKSGDNLVLTNAGIVDVYLNNSYQGSATYFAAKTITYNYKSTDNGTVKTATSVTAGQGKTVTLPNVSVSGYNFYGWYTGYSSGVFSSFVGNGGASYTVPSSNTSLYGRYIANGYGYLLGSFNSWNPTSAYRFSAVDSPETGYRYFRRTFAVNEEFYIFFCHASGSGSDGNYHWSDRDGNGDATGCFTDSSGNFKCTVAGQYDILLNTTSGKVLIYHSNYVTTTGYYMSGTGTFGSPDWAISSATVMGSGTASGNTAVLENGTTGFAVTSGSKFKVVLHSSANSNTWYNMTLGGTYGFATIEDNAVKITADGSYNFYFKIDNGTNYMYIVDVSEIATAGFIYISSPATIGNISVTTTNTKSESAFSGAALNTVEGAAQASTTLKFDDGFVYLVPLFNLRGADSGSPCTAVTFSWSSPSSGSIALTSVNGIGGDSERYYITGSGTASSVASETEYEALSVALDIDTAIAKASNKSVCNISKDDAEDLCDAYDSASDTYLPAATITTWNSVKPTYSGSQDATLAAIRVELGKRAGGSYVISSGVIPGPTGAESPLTTTLWIVLASGAAGLSAIGAAYFISKKKKRHQA